MASLPHLDPASPTTGEPPAYYKLPDCDLTQRVKNFDSPAQLEDFVSRVKDARSESFVLDYGPDEAWCAFDLTATELSKLVNTPRPSSIKSRWIHIWYPHKHTERIDVLAKRYQFSPRLTGLMKSTPLAHAPPRHKDEFHGDHHHTRWPRSSGSAPPDSVDTERALHLDELGKSEAKANPLEDLDHYDMVNSIWHWSSVDLGRKYLCLGYNSLHNVTVNSSGSNLPDADRIWSWLVLGDDETTLSISESRLVPYEGDASGTRRSLINVFQQLSKATDRSKRNPISIVPIRLPTANDTAYPDNAAGLLFFYLFDDWSSTYSLFAKHEHQYGYELNRLRKKMMHEAQLSHVDQLFCVGRQLATLKRLYQSYELLIGKILEKNRVPGPLEITGQLETSDPQHNYNRELLGVRLDQDALVRFERLRDRIRLYVLSEIKECIDTKDAMLMMNFNLITIKEANAVERLTRITILLAKVTILFLPVSLATGYFSINFPEVDFTQTAYWTTFAVVLILSFLTLFIFGKISGTIEANMMYRPIYKAAGDIFKTFVRKQ